MTMEELNYRLRHMYYDLRCSNVELLKKLLLYGATKKDREEIFRQMYDLDYLPVKVNNLGESFQEDTDMECFDNYVQGFEEYLRQQEMEIDLFIRNNQIAVNIFLHLIRLKSPYSDVLYLLYFKNVDAKDVKCTMFLSRPSFYRVKKNAMIELLNSINNDE